MFCESFFVILSFFFWPLCCLFFFDLRILITPLVSSNSSYILFFPIVILLVFLHPYTRCLWQLCCLFYLTYQLLSKYWNSGNHPKQALFMASDHFFGIFRLFLSLYSSTGIEFFFKLLHI
jgi:hypothetical protein